MAYQTQKFLDSAFKSTQMKRNMDVQDRNYFENNNRFAQQQSLRNQIENRITISQNKSDAIAMLREQRMQNRDDRTLEKMDLEIEHEKEKWDREEAHRELKEQTNKEKLNRFVSDKEFRDNVFEKQKKITTFNLDKTIADAAFKEKNRAIDEKYNTLIAEGNLSHSELKEQTNKEKLNRFVSNKEFRDNVFEKQKKITTFNLDKTIADAAFKEKNRAIDEKYNTLIAEGNLSQAEADKASFAEKQELSNLSRKNAIAREKIISELQSSKDEATRREAVHKLDLFDEQDVIDALGGQENIDAIRNDISNDNGSLVDFVNGIRELQKNPNQKLADKLTKVFQTGNDTIYGVVTPDGKFIINNKEHPLTEPLLRVLEKGALKTAQKEIQQKNATKLINSNMNMFEGFNSPEISDANINAYKQNYLLINKLKTLENIPREPSQILKLEGRDRKFATNLAALSMIQEIRADKTPDLASTKKWIELLEDASSSMISPKIKKATLSALQDVQQNVIQNAIGDRNAKVYQGKRNTKEFYNFVDQFKKDINVDIKRLARSTKNDKLSYAGFGNAKDLLYEDILSKIDQKLPSVKAGDQLVWDKNQHKIIAFSPNGYGRENAFSNALSDAFTFGKQDLIPINNVKSGGISDEMFLYLANKNPQALKGVYKKRLQDIEDSAFNSIGE